MNDILKTVAIALAVIVVDKMVGVSDMFTPAKK